MKCLLSLLLMIGNIRKMKSRLTDIVEYTLPLSEYEIPMNPIIGSEIAMHFTGQIHCLKCGRKTSKSFSQGYCYPCFISAPETEECVIRPELCQAHEGIARDMEYAATHCLIDQYVYLSLTSEIKVGVTRSTQIPTRWIDQGAAQALIFAKTPNRYLAGLIEVTLKSHISDKTNWRNMLKGVCTAKRTLIEMKEVLKSELPDALKEYFITDNTLTHIQYPVDEYPLKINALSFDKTPDIQGTLKGIKGQYLMLDNGRVINMRKFGGYEVEVSII